MQIYNFLQHFAAQLKPYDGTPGGEHTHMEHIGMCHPEYVEHTVVLKNNSCNNVSNINITTEVHFSYFLLIGGEGDGAAS
jgi:hypothetical protein